MPQAGPHMLADDADVLGQFMRDERLIRQIRVKTWFVKVWMWLYPDSVTAPERPPLSSAKPTFEPALRFQRIKFQTETQPPAGRPGMPPGCGATLAAPSCFPEEPP